MKSKLTIMLAVTLFLAPLGYAAPVPDTGQTTCYDDLGNEITCPLPGEPFYGQDANYTINAHSYTDLENGIVRDNVTGLEWQQITAPGYYTMTDAITYCEGLELGGYTDWRLPTVTEISTVLDAGTAAWALPLDQVDPGDADESFYRTSNVCAGDAALAWYVGNSGTVNNFFAAGTAFVRAVRGGQPEPEDRFVENGDGTVTDTATGLMWQQVPAPRYAYPFIYNWEYALAYCEALILNTDGQWTSGTSNSSGAKYSDWRLPNRNELQSLVDYSAYNPSIDTAFMPGTDPSRFWSSTTYAGDMRMAYYCNFEDGSVHRVSKLTAYDVRAVRSVSCGYFGDSDDDGVCDDGDASGVAGDTPCTGGETVSCDDNCPYHYNPDQIDTDSDGRGDPCEDCRIRYHVEGSSFGGPVDTTDVVPTEETARTQQATIETHSAIMTQYGLPMVGHYWENGCYGRETAAGTYIWTCQDGFHETYNDFAVISGRWTVVCADESDDDIDWVLDAVDNCPDTYNPEQTDSDDDGIGDACDPVLITLSSFSAQAESGKIALTWSTASEINNAGFNLYRAAGKGPFKKITAALIPAEGSPAAGAVYEYVDTDVRNRTTYRYLLEDVDLTGIATQHGPVKATPRLLKGEAR